MKHLQLRFYYGVGKDKDGQELEPGDVGRRDQRLRAHVAGQFGGFTEIFASGGWRDENGLLVLEPSRVIEVLTLDTEENRAKAAFLAAYIKELFNQSEVLYTHHSVHMEVV